MDWVVVRREAFPMNCAGFWPVMHCNLELQGITVLSLGCQHAQVSILEREISQKISQFQEASLGLSSSRNMLPKGK